MTLSEGIPEYALIKKDDFHSSIPRFISFDYSCLDDIYYMWKMQFIFLRFFSTTFPVFRRITLLGSCQEGLFNRVNKIIILAFLIALEYTIY